MNWIKTISVHELSEGELHGVTLDGGKRIILIREGSQVYALDNRCSHDNGDLEGGQVYEGVVECPRHGALFDIKTGKVRGLPAVVDIPAFPVDIRDGVVYVGI